MRFIKEWIRAHQAVWGSHEDKVTTGLIVTNSGNGKCQEGTPIYASTADGGTVKVSLGEDDFFFGTYFEVDHKKQVVRSCYHHNGDLMKRDLPALTDAQKRVFGVDFGGQYSS